MMTQTAATPGDGPGPATLQTFDAAARLAKFGVWDFDLVTEKLTWSAGVYEIFGIPDGTRLARPDVVARYVDESRETMERMRAEAIRTGGACVFEANVRALGGGSRWIRLWLEVAQQDDAPRRIFGAQQDITAEREALERLRRMAEHDALTGLANRGLFDAHYRDIVADTLHHGGVAALVLIDLDNFKHLNDAHGHAAGDACLRRTAERLLRVFADARLVARVGGDEFAVLMRAPLGTARIRSTLHRALTLLRKPMTWTNRRLELGASIGATIIGQPHRRRASDLFAEADAALYAAKKSGRGGLHVFGDADLAQAARA